MKVNGIPYRSIWVDADDARTVCVVDQTRLPHAFAVARLATLDDALRAVTTMQVRGAPLIGATAAYGICLAMRADPSDAALTVATDALRRTRPTAVNLQWALDMIVTRLRRLEPAQRVEEAYDFAAALCDGDAAINRSIGDHGLALLQERAQAKGGEPVQVMTHCNAGWLATVDYGTALAPVYRAHDDGVPVHVWVSETRPRNQGAALTAWELAQHGVPHTLIADNAAGHLLQRGLVDLCLTGADRVAANGDVANKIGTYLKALAARDNGVPFYVAAPSPSVDWHAADGGKIPIEERDGDEVTQIRGRLPESDQAVSVILTPPGTPAANFGFDITPHNLITAFITERGPCLASEGGLAALFPERLVRKWDFDEDTPPAERAP